MLPLLYDLHKNQDGEDHTHRSVQANQRADQAENDSDQGKLGQQTDQGAANDVDDHVDQKGDDERLQFSRLEGIGEVFPCLFFSSGKKMSTNPRHFPGNSFLQKKLQKFRKTVAVCRFYDIITLNIPLAKSRKEQSYHG